MRKSQLTRVPTMGPLSFKPKPPQQTTFIAPRTVILPAPQQQNNTIEDHHSTITSDTISSSTQQLPPPQLENQQNIEQQPQIIIPSYSTNQEVTTESYNAAVGQLRVMQSRINQLEEELFCIKAEAVIRDAEIKSHKSKTEQDRIIEDLETRIGFQEREKQDADERWARSERAQVDLMARAEHAETELKRLQEMRIKLESSVQTLETRLALRDREVSDTSTLEKRDKSSFLKEVGCETTHAARKRQHTTTTTAADDRVIVQRILNDSYQDLFALVSVGGPHAQSLFTSLTSVTLGSMSTSDMISSALRYLEDATITDPCRISVLRLLQTCVERLSTTMTTALVLVNHTARVLATNPSDTVVIAALALLLTLARTNAASVSQYESFAFLLSNEHFIGKVADCDDVAGDLLELLMSRDSKAVPEGWPVDDVTWQSTPSPLWARHVMVDVELPDNLYRLKRAINRCRGLIEQHDDDGAKFLLHYGGMTRLIDVLYHRATFLKTYAAYEELSLLAALWPAAVSSNALRALSDEHRHRLLESLMWFREAPSSGRDDSTVSRLACQFLRNMGYEGF